MYLASVILKRKVFFLLIRCMTQTYRSEKSRTWFSRSHHSEQHQVTVGRTRVRRGRRVAGLNLPEHHRHDLPSKLSPTLQPVQKHMAVQTVGGAQRAHVQYPDSRTNGPLSFSELTEDSRLFSSGWAVITMSYLCSHEGEEGGWVLSATDALTSPF